MNRRTFNQEQIVLIERISAVLKCSEKAITYTKEFKLKALKQYKEGLSPTEIFIQAGFDIQLIGNKTPRRSIARWRKTKRIHKRQGKIGRPKKMWDTDTERIQYLEAQVAYLKAENCFLAKLRAKKTE